MSDCENDETFVKCATPRCRNESEIEYLGKPLCGACWDKHCMQKEETK